MKYEINEKKYGDVMTEIEKYKDGYRLMAYSPESICYGEYYISKEDGDEILKYKDNPNKVFNGNGGKEIFNRHYSKLREITGYDDIIKTCLNDTEVFNFMEKIWEYVKTDFKDYMFKSLDDIDAFTEVDVYFLNDDSMSMKDTMRRYVMELT